MQTHWLILVSLILPLIWGWAVNRLLVWLWPEQQSLAARNPSAHRPAPFADYQI
jgi:hypothetical protein